MDTKQNESIKLNFNQSQLINYDGLNLKTNVLNILHFNNLKQIIVIVCDPTILLGGWYSIFHGGNNDNSRVSCYKQGGGKKEKEELGTSDR